MARESAHSSVLGGRESRPRGAGDDRGTPSSEETGAGHGGLASKSEPP